MKIQETELYNIKGGAITATLLNAVARTINTILNLGQTVGSAIYRIINKSYC